MNRPALKGQILSRSLLLVAVFVASSGIFFLPDARANFSETLTSADVNNSYSVGFSDTIPGGSTLSALGTFALSSLTSSVTILDWTVKNTTTNASSSLNPIVLNSLGFNGFSVSGAQITTPGSYFKYAYSPGNVDSFKSENVCLTGDSNNCSGGHSGLTPGMSDSFVLALDGTFGSSPSITLSDFAVKFQTNEGSYEFGGSSLSETPEPGTLLLFATALFLSLGPALRRGLALGMAQAPRG